MDGCAVAKEEHMANEPANQMHATNASIEGAGRKGNKERVLRERMDVPVELELPVFVGGWPA